VRNQGTTDNTITDRDQTIDPKLRQLKHIAESEHFGFLVVYIAAQRRSAIYVPHSVNLCRAEQYAYSLDAGRKIILLLNGYDKGADDSAKRQEREIARARKLLTAYRESQRRATRSKNTR
jgi:hypothetical protein